jgi:hypothetical protein
MQILPFKGLRYQNLDSKELIVFGTCPGADTFSVAKGLIILRDRVEGNASYIQWFGAVREYIG